MSTNNDHKVNKFKFGAYIKGLRRAIEGMTLRKASFKSGVSAGYLSQVERGVRDIPTPDILKKLAPVYKMSYEELMIDAGYWKKPEGNMDDPAIKEKILLYMEYYKIAEDAANADISPEQFKRAINLLKEMKKQG